MSSAAFLRWKRKRPLRRGKLGEKVYVKPIEVFEQPAKPQEARSTLPKNLKLGYVPPHKMSKEEWKVYEKEKIARREAGQLVAWGRIDVSGLCASPNSHDAS